MKINLAGLVICVLLLIWSFTGLKENLSAIHYVFLMVGSGMGMGYFGWNAFCDLLFS